MLKMERIAYLRNFFFSLLALVGLFSMSQEMKADPLIPAATVISPGSLGWFGVYTIGWEFTLSNPYTVDYLGFYGNPLSENHNVAIWDSTQNVLVTGLVHTSDPQYGGFYWTQLATPVTLTPGTYVIGGYETNQSYIWPANGANVTFDPNVGYVHALYQAGGSGITYPTSTYPGTEHNPAYFGVNFASAVPEPSSLLLLGNGLGGLALAAWRRKKA